MNIHEKLFQAVHQNKIDKVLELIEMGADIGAREELGRTPLHYACAYSETEIALILIEKGADIGARDNVGRTPLHSACYNGKTKTALMLIEKGADVGAKDDYGDIPRDLASGELKILIKKKKFHNFINKIKKIFL